MKFLNNLYTVSTICKEINTPYTIIRFNHSHELYKAHFPENPITPGVVVLQIATNILQNIIGKHLQLKKIENIKFNIPIGPKDSAKITYTKLEEHNNQLIAIIRIENSDNIYAKMSLIYSIIAHP